MAVDAKNFIVLYQHVCVKHLLEHTILATINYSLVTIGYAIYKLPPAKWIIDGNLMGPFANGYRPKSKNDFC